MLSRTAISLLLPLCLIGCSKSSPENAAADRSRTNTPAESDEQPDHSDLRVAQQQLSADRLAKMLDLNVWTFTYSGGPVRCWLEIEEVGQQTIPNRLPEQETVDSNDVEGDIVLWWGDRTSGKRAIYLIVNGNSYSYTLGEKDFHYGWRSSFAMYPPQGREKEVGVVAGEEVILMSYQVSGPSPDEEDVERQKVTIHLKAIFGKAKSQE